LSVTETVINGITNVISELGYPGVFLWMTIESACVPIPSEAIMPFAGKLIATDSRFNIYVLSLVGALGNLAGSCLAYWVGAIGGRPFVEKYGKFLLITHQDLDMADRWFTKYGEATAFLSRLLPLVRAYISLPAGISKMPFGKFCFFTFLGALPFCYALTYAGVKLGEHWQAVSKVLHKADLAVLLIVAIFLALWIYRHLRPRPSAVSA
jgi:membrane protein DedA with SNARE-associated domain